MDLLKIYLADLTYTTVTLSTEAMPLNIGYVAAYCNKIHGSQVEIKLFKYIDDLEFALETTPPDVLALSNYCWNHVIGLTFFQKFHRLNRKGITVWGGPNFPFVKDQQIEFLEQRADVDVYIPNEGEVGFSNLIDLILSQREIDRPGELTLPSAPEGCIIRNSNGDLLFGQPANRIKTLDSIPSPYLTGLMDSFFDHQLKPEIQTNRGCPFTCTFCVDGSDIVNKVHKFSIERIGAEIEYICQKVAPEIGTLGIADLNFGMYSRDLEICEILKSCQDKYKYPTNILTTTGKNKKEKVANTVKMLNGTLMMSMSVQSLDENVLNNIGRQNINTENMLGIMKEVNEVNLLTLSEVIIGLPGDTFDTNVETIRTLFNSGVDSIQMYTLMLLEGSKLNTPLERSKWGFQTKWRVLPRDFVELASGERVIELEEVVVASNSLSFCDYLNLRKIALIIFVVSHGILFDPLRKLFSSLHIDYFDLIMEMFRNQDWHGVTVKTIIDKFLKDTKKELWSSPEALNNYYRDEHNWQSLITGTSGNNLIQHYHAVIVAEAISEWIDYTFHSAQQVLDRRSDSDRLDPAIVPSIKDWCVAMSDGVLELNDNSAVQKELSYDILGWLESGDSGTIDNWRTDVPVRIGFNYGNQRRDRFARQLDIYGNSPTGRAQTLKRLNVRDLWRTPERCS